MPEIIKPLTFDDLPTDPPLTGRPRISDDIQQTVALLSGWDGATRRLLKASPSGVLYTCSPPVKGIINITANQASYNWQGDDISTSEVLILNQCKNAGDVWVQISKAASVDNGYLLDCGDSLIISLNNLRSLHIHIVNTDKKAIVIYTK